jgi:hypothetical protein
MSTALDLRNTQTGIEEIGVGAKSHPAYLNGKRVTLLLSGEHARIVLTEHGQQFSRELLLGWLRDRRLQVQSPLSVKFAREDQDIVAEAVELNEFGFGKNLSEALTDLQATIVELYFMLNENRERLGPDLERVWATLQSKIVLRP